MNQKLPILLVLIASISGCVTLPEPGSELRGYQPQTSTLPAAIPLPLFQTEAVNEMVCATESVEFEQFIVACDANTAALMDAADAFAAKAREADFLLLAGRQAELQAEIYHAVANGHSATIQALAWPATGLSALIILLIAL